MDLKGKKEESLNSKNRKIGSAENKKRYLTPNKNCASSLKVKSFTLEKIVPKPSKNYYPENKTMANDLNHRNQKNFGQIGAYVVGSSKSQIYIGKNIEADFSIPIFPSKNYYERPKSPIIAHLDSKHFSKLNAKTLYSGEQNISILENSLETKTNQNEILQINDLLQKRILELGNEMNNLLQKNKELEEKIEYQSKLALIQADSPRKKPYNKDNYHPTSSETLLQSSLEDLKKISTNPPKFFNQIDIPQEPAIIPLSITNYKQDIPQGYSTEYSQISVVNTTQNTNPSENYPQGYNTVDPSSNYNYNQNQGWDKYVSEATHAIQYWWSQFEDFKAKYYNENQKVLRLEKENIELRNECESLNKILKSFEMKKFKKTEESKLIGGKNKDFDMEIKELKEIIRVNFGIIEKKDSVIKVLEEKLIMANEKIYEVENKAMLLAMKINKKAEEKCNKECFGFDKSKSDDYYKRLYLEYLQEITYEDKCKAELHKII